MRILVRTISALALAALVALVPAATTSAAKKPKLAAWAKKHDLTGNWRSKDADKDGLKNLAEYKLRTHPRKADSDRDGLKDGDELASGNDPVRPDSDDDGIKDGAEHAGVVTAYDGETITIRQFKGGTLTAPVDDLCDPLADDASFEDEDDGFVDVEETEDVPEEDFEADSASVDEGETEVDLGEEDEDVSCDLADVAEDDVLTSAELETRDGVTYVIAVEIA